MDNPEYVPSKFEIIGQIIYHLINDSDNVDSSVQGLFSRVFVRYDQYQHYLTHSNFQRNLFKFPYQEQEEEELEEEEEEDYNENDDKQEELVRKEFDNFWAENGQDIILKLWVEKYKDFVDPAYDSNISNNLTSSDEKHNIDNLNQHDSSVENTVNIDTITSIELHETNICSIERTKRKDPLDQNSFSNKNLCKHTEIIDETQCHVENKDVKNGRDNCAPNQLDLNSINIISESLDKCTARKLDTENTIASSDDQSECYVNGDNFSHQWDILWQDHCLEVYNAHFESFKEDWLKNLAATLDAVNSTTGQEYFELIKQEVLTKSQKQIQNKQKSKKEPSLEDSSRLKQNHVNSRQQQKRAYSVSSVLNNLTEIVKKYDQYEDNLSPSDDKEMTETINNKPDKDNEKNGKESERRDEIKGKKADVTHNDNQYLETDEERIGTNNKNTNTFIDDNKLVGGKSITDEENGTEKVPTEITCVVDLQETVDVVKKLDHIQKVDDMESLNKRKVDGDDSSYLELKAKHRQKLDKDQEVEKHHIDSEKSKSDSSSSEEEVDLDEAIDTIPSSYNKFVDQPNYLLNKLGLHFGSAASTDEETTCPPVFFKSQKLNLFVSKSKFKTLNHRLKIDTKDFTDEYDDEMEEESAEFKTHIKNVDGLKSVNKHTYFNYSDDDDLDDYNKIEKKEDSMKEIIKTNEDESSKLNEIFDKKENSFKEIAKTKGKLYKNMDKETARFTSKSNAFGHNLNDEDLDEAPDEISSKIDPAPTESLGETSNCIKQCSPSIGSAARKSDIIDNPPVFVFNARKSLDSTNIENQDQTGFVFKARNALDNTNCETQDQTGFVFKARSSLDSTNCETQDQTAFVFKVRSSLDNTNCETQDQTAFVFKVRSSLDSTTIEAQTNLTGEQAEYKGETLGDELPCLESFYGQSAKKKQKQKMKQQESWSEEKNVLSYDDDLGDDVPAEILANPYLNKYYLQRYLYWSRYDEGIQMDEESWYSVTPEKVAQHIASRFSESDVVVDAFCGCGGNTIQFALVCQKVISIDIDPHKIRLAHHNAQVYGVAHKVQFITGDFFALAPHLRADAVFLSPPWGGPEYARSSFTIGNIFPEAGGGKRLYDVAVRISRNVGYYLPRTTDVFELIPLAGPGNTCEVEQNFVGRKFVAMTAYYGNLVKRKVKRKKKKKQKTSQFYTSRALDLVYVEDEHEK